MDLNRLDVAAAAEVVNAMRAALDVKPERHIDAEAFRASRPLSPALDRVGLESVVVQI
ncbi:MAG: hypothetical protein U0670_10730 [Anaerolineae bacterium]